MKYTPMERKKRVLEIIGKDPECQGFARSMDQDRAVHEMLAARLPPEEERELWAFPITLHLYHGRVLELVCREMRLPEEDGTP